MRTLTSLLIIFFLMLNGVSAQVSINTDGDAPNNSAMLDVKSLNKGLLPPRLTTSQRTSVNSPAAGLLIFNSDCNDMQFFDGAGWIPMGNTGLLTTPGTISGSTSPCVGSSGNIYSISAIPNATGYHWTVPAGSVITGGQGTTAVTVTFGTTGGVICVSAYNECYKSTMSCLSVSLTPASPVSLTISASANPFCAFSSVTFTATPVNGGTNPSYQWYKNNTSIPGATNSTYAYNPVNGDAIKCILTSSLICKTGSPATSNIINMSVTLLQNVSVVITSTATAVCAGTSVIFTAYPTNGGLSPAYQWKKNNVIISGATSVTYTYTPVNNDVINCVMQSSLPCTSGNPATSNSIPLTVDPVQPVSLTITESANPSCSGSSVTFTATPVNGGPNPIYQWRTNGVDIITATSSTYSYVPLNNDSIRCRLTSSLTCKSGSPAWSNMINMGVNAPLPVSVTVSPNATLICEGTLVTYSAYPVNGGSTPLFQWLKNGVDIDGATNSTYGYAPLPGDLIACRVTSSLNCVTGNPATAPPVGVTIIPGQPVSITISALINPFCTGASVTLSSIAQNPGTAPIYQWKVNGSNISGATATTYTYAPSNNDQVQCVLTSNVLCGTNNPATSNTVVLKNVIDINHVAGAVAPVSKNVSYGTVKNIPGETSKCWITRNLGASQQATVVSDATEASAGWYWQFNRKQGYKHDGSTLTPAWTVTSINENAEWSLSNDPCRTELASTWRIPTYTEWNNVDITGSWTIWNGPWLSGLKLHAAGYLGNMNGAVTSRGSIGNYWSSNQNGSTNGYLLEFTSGTCLTTSNIKARGMSLRCIRD